MIKFYISFLLLGFNSLGFSTVADTVQSSNSNQRDFIPDSIVKILGADLAEAYGEANQEIIAWVQNSKAPQKQLW